MSSATPIISNEKEKRAREERKKIYQRVNTIKERKTESVCESPNKTKQIEISRNNPTKINLYMRKIQST